MFSEHVLSPGAFAARFAQLIPEYLPGVDTGAFEPTDIRRCWNKTLGAVLTVIGKEAGDINVSAQSPMVTALKDQSSLLWQRDGAPLLAMTTGWGDRSGLEQAFEWLEALKCPQKLFVYSCSKWHEAVLDQIRGALIRYPYHLEGEQYLFLNLVGSENRFHLVFANIERNGRQAFADGTVLRPVPGSPFSWNTRYKQG
jgi:hypothetical protein